MLRLCQRWRLISRRCGLDDYSRCHYPVSSEMIIQKTRSSVPSLFTIAVVKITNLSWENIENLEKVIDYTIAHVPFRNEGSKSQICRPREKVFTF